MLVNLPAGYEAARTQAALFDVRQRGKITAAGKEAAVFLHNLSTNDIKNLPPGTGCETFFCTATARVVAHGWIWRQPPQDKRETLWLDLPAGSNEKLFAHLDRYLISEDVTLDDRTWTLAQFHLAGPRAAEILAAPGLAAGEWKRGVFEQHEELTIRHVDHLSLPGFDLLCPLAREQDLLDRLLAAGAVQASDEAFEVLRIEAGVPLYGKDMDDNTFAPEVGRSAAISYNKGCYIGQEPIVMARDRGVVQRKLVGLQVGPEPIPAGSLLYREGKEVGRTTSSIRSPRLGQALALGYVRRGSQQPGTELEVDISGQRHKVQVIALPLG